ncbi:MAG: hypothetical protein LBC67_02875 [Spirochaetales bacterium]|jgi:hypothetical protein|nr:hypothetical protein [Spirochaetales bacterium]
MKKNVCGIFLAVLAVVLAAGCASGGSVGGGGGSSSVSPAQPEAVQPIVKKPDMLDHKNFKWGTQPPEWVTMNIDELEALDKYKNDYAFKFESPVAQNLQGAELWTKNFTAGAEIAGQVKTRVQAKFAGAAAGDINELGTYMENTVKSLSDASFSGFRQRDNYWVQMRYYKEDGNKDKDGFTYLALYTIPRTTLDKMIQDALAGAESTEKPKTENEKTARERVKESLKEGF